MAELVRVDAPSLADVEAFLRRELGEPVRLGDVWLAAGRSGAAVAAVSNASAVTLRNVICLSSECARSLAAAAPETRVLDVLGSLLVHECVHVWQYRRAGTPRFLTTYCFSYLMSINALRSIDARSRMQSYRAIPAEREAFRLETRWLERARLDSPRRSGKLPSGTLPS